MEIRKQKLNLRYHYMNGIGTDKDETKAFEIVF
jgi:hypothetical protein